MADVKISQLVDGAPAQDGDQIPVNRSGSNYRITAGDIVDLVTDGLTVSKPVFTDANGDFTSTGTVPVNQGGTGATTASDARTNLGLGSIATQSASSVAITGGSIAGITDLALADGGTGASTAAGARTNLLPSYAGNATKVLKVNAGATDVEWAEQSAGGITSITAGTGLSGGTITSTGTIALATAYGDTVNPYAAKTANYVLAAPNGSSGAPTFRALVAADVPTLNQNTTGNAATATALQTARTINGVSFDGTANITVADSTKLPLAGGTMTGSISFDAGQTWPTFNQNTTGTASNVTGTVAIANGGTGATTESGARTALGVPASPTGTNTQLLANDGSGGFSNVTVGSGLDLTSGTLTATGSGSGTVTSVGLTMPSGFTVANSPVTTSGTIAVTTALSGILKGNGSGFTTATSGTDYAPATSGTSILYGNGSGGFSNVTVGTGLSFSAGTLSATGAGGSGDVVGPSSATDSQIALFDGTTGKLIKAASTSGLLKASSGVIAAATSGTDYAPATSGTSILKGSGSGGFSNATAGTDYLAPPSGSAILKANSGGALANATAGTDYLAPPSGTSLLKANSGGALANATASTDYAPATTGTSAQLLANNGTGGFSNVTVGSNLTLSAGTLSATGGLAWQSVQTTGFTAVAGRAYPCNTTSAAFTVTLPASATAGDQITLTDYAGTWATNNLTINPNGLKIRGSTDNQQVVTNNNSLNLVYIDSTRGWLVDSAVTSTPFAPPPSSVEYLVVAGGGGAGHFNSGGGGAGGYRTNSSFSVTAGTSYTVTVGAGGPNAGSSGGQAGSPGSNSVFSSITSNGGGGGGGINSSQGGNGGSGGGSYGGGSGGTGNTPSTSPSQGNNGGGGGSLSSGGGGGASAVGANAASSIGGNGGNGTASTITGPSVTYAGGGGGGSSVSNSTGGSGGGGAGSGSGAGTNGTANLGGGGGGGGGAANVPGGNGGAGVVIIAYPSNFANLSSIGAGLTYTLDATTRTGYKVYKFTAGTGTISW